MESQNPLEQAACEGHSQLFEELGIWSASPHPGEGRGGQSRICGNSCTFLCVPGAGENTLRRLAHFLC